MHSCFINIISSCIVDEGRKDPNTSISRQTSARLRNAFKMAFRCRGGGVGGAMRTQH